RWGARRGRWRVGSWVLRPTPHSPLHPFLILDQHRALAFHQQLEHLRHILVPHSDAAHAGLLTDAVRVDRAVDAVALFADGVAVNADQAHPVLAQRIARVAGFDDAFAARAVIRWVLDLVAGLQHPLAGGG